MLTLMEIEDISEDLRYQLQQLTNKGLIDFALEHLGPEHEIIRQSALQEHFIRVRDASSTVKAPSGDMQVLRSKLVQLLEAQTSSQKGSGVWE